eukprot:scpid110198/ scgid25907/ 
MARARTQVWNEINHQGDNDTSSAFPPLIAKWLSQLQIEVWNAALVNHASVEMSVIMVYPAPRSSPYPQRRRLVDSPWARRGMRAEKSSELRTFPGMFHALAPRKRRATRMFGIMDKDEKHLR